jgi:two-component system, OmpR family, response regulator
MRILLVEDEPNLLRTVSKRLREEGYVVDQAADGEQGISKATDVDYDLVVLDVLLPKLDGWEVLRQLRRQKKTPVLMLTARDATSDQVRGLDGGADDYQTKPFVFDELLARVRALIRRSNGNALPQIKIGEVTIDTAARKVFLGSELVTLTPREYLLLQFLAVRRGQVVTRTMAYEHLFGEGEDDTMSNLIDVHISNLRKKLGHDFVTTRRGHGYCIE